MKKILLVLLAAAGAAFAKKKMEEGGFVLTDIGYKEMPAFMAAKKKEYAALADKLGIKKQ